jgi:hypothetical protein
MYQYIIWYVSLCVGDCLVCLVCRSGGTGIPGIPDDLLMQLILLMMSNGLLETCGEVK